MPQSKLKISNLTVSYGSKVVLKDFSLTFYPGEIHGILGINGAGKTTLFKTIYDILTPDQGNIAFKGFSKAANNIAYLETEPFFYPYMTGREYLELLSLHNNSFSPDAWNSLFNLPLNDFIETYSTGMKKKLSVLGVLALDRPIMLLDEPHNGLDLESVVILHKVLKELKSKGKLILLTSHIFDVLRKNCDKISLLHSHTVESTFDKNEFSELENHVESLIDVHSDTLLKNLLG